jgi:glyoxylase-like metal-dependent hydrolase (beta-lactamase superfamily II)
VRCPALIALTLAGSALTPGTPLADPQPDRGFTIDKLADGVYAVVRHETPGLATRANNVFIVNDEDVMVVDTSQSPRETREVLAALRKITRKPVHYVINTHWHDDHYLGNEVYCEAYQDVDVVAHVSTTRAVTEEIGPNRTRMLARLPATVGRLRGALDGGLSLGGWTITPEERSAYASDIDWAENYLKEVPGAPLAPPTIAVSDRLTLKRGSRIIDVRSVGAGHSRADLIVHLPKEGIVIAGDLVTAPVPLVVTGSSIGSWAAALEQIRALQPSIIVPGHGPVLRDDSQLRLMEALFTSIADQVGSAVAQGLTLEETQARVRLEDWRARFAGSSRLRGFLFDTNVTGPGVAAAYSNTGGR